MDIDPYYKNLQHPYEYIIYKYPYNPISYNHIFFGSFTFNFSDNI